MSFVQYKDNLSIFGNKIELQEFFDEELANLNNILGSRYLMQIRSDVERLRKNILQAQEIMDDFWFC
ncbi:MAG: hypothetical protein ACTSWQ_06220 [Candidatus Thorarchaeota archaeon]